MSILIGKASIEPRDYRVVFVIQKIGTSVTCSDVAKQSDLDAVVPKALSRKRLVVKQRRYECVYKWIADLNVTFCEKGAATKHIKNDHFASGHFDCSVVCCDLAKQSNIDTTVPKALSRKRLVAKQRRYERVYEWIADLNVTFYEKGAATEDMKNDHLQSGHFDCSVVCCDVVGMTRFELATSWTPFKHSTKLSHIPIVSAIL